MTTLYFLSLHQSPNPTTFFALAPPLVPLYAWRASCLVLAHPPHEPIPPLFYLIVSLSPLSRFVDIYLCSSAHHRACGAITHFLFNQCVSVCLTLPAAVHTLLSMLSSFPCSPLTFAFCLVRLQLLDVAAPFWCKPSCSGITIGSFEIQFICNTLLLYFYQGLKGHTLVFVTPLPHLGIICPHPNTLFSAANFFRSGSHVSQAAPIPSLRVQASHALSDGFIAPGHFC